MPYSDSPSERSPLALPGGVAQTWQPPEDIQHLLDASPDELIRYVRELHDNLGVGIDNRSMDLLLLGTVSTEAEKVLWAGEHFYGRSRKAEKLRYPGEVAWTGTGEGIWTPYELIRRIFHDLVLTSSDTFYDLGCGYGRMVLYAGITSAAACRGIEMVSERAEITQAAIGRLGLDNTQVSCSKVQDENYSDGNVFYLFQPFSYDTFELVYDQLEAIAAKKPITLISRNASVSNAMSRGRLRQLSLVGCGVGGEYRNYQVEFFESPEIADSPESRILLSHIDTSPHDDLDCFDDW